MSALDLAPELPIRRPYPGLRPFEVNEALLFYGRQEHTRNLLERLSHERFLAAVGSSGTGKSSLVRAGLLPALFRGYLVGASSQWRIAMMRPGNAPLRELAKSLAQPHALGGDADEKHQVLGLNSLGLVELVRRAGLANRENVLLVVDQFEELFRFDRERGSQDQSAESSLFVQSLLEAVEAHDPRIYVVITMRSDFLGHCTRFAGLAEVLNRSQFLIPHLTRSQRQEAIEKPPQLAGVSIKPALVQRLLNDLGEDPARLPVLQHTLMQTFEQLGDDCREMDFDHYEKSGKIEGALNLHAEDIVKSLSPSARSWVEKLFRSLTTVEAGRAIRRPARVARIYEVLGIASNTAARAAVDEAILAFVQPGNSLLVSSTGTALNSDSVIDISHESLIGGWRSLKDWLEKESRSAAVFKSLAEAALRHHSDEGGLWRDPDLRLANQVKNEDAWNEVWARQYATQGGPEFHEVERFLELSEANRLREERKDRLQKAGIGLGILAAILLILSLVYVAYSRWQQHLKEQATNLERTLLASDLEAERRRKVELERNLKVAEISLGDARSQGEEARGLQEKVLALENQIRTATELEKAAKVRLDEALTVPVPAEIPELAAERKKTAALEKDLRDADTELQRQKAGFEASEAALRLRLEQAQNDNTQLSAKLAKVSEPLLLRLEPASLIRLTARPFAGRVYLFTRGASDSTPTLKLFFLAPGPNAPPLDEFRDEPSKSSKIADDLKSWLKCPGYVSDELGQAWCLEIENQFHKKQYPLELGSFRFEGIPYGVTATGWAFDSRRLSSSNTLIIYAKSETGQKSQ